MTTRSGFVVNQVRVRRPDDAITGLSQAQAKIDVVEGHAKIDFVESFQLFEHRFAHGHARSGHRGTVLLEHRAVKISGMPPRNVRKRVTRHAAEPEHDAAMLQRPVRVPETRPDRADFRSRRVADHLRQPAGIVDLSVVVQKNQDVAARFCRRAVVQPTVIKRSALSDDANVLLFYRAEESDRLRFDRAVIDDDYFEWAIFGPRSNALDATLQQLWAISRRDDNRDERRRFR